MNDLRVCTQGAGFAVVGALTVTALTLSAFGQGADNASTAVPIAAGVTTAGTTVGFNNTTDATCPYSGSTSPDVFYSYSSPAGSSFSVSLCESGYDTKTYVFDNATGLLAQTSNGMGDACNDDACSSSGGGLFRSLLLCVLQGPLGSTIAVDGWGGDQGPYNILVNQQADEDCAPPPACLVECPPGFPVEPDDCDFGNTAPNDTVNGGCNSSPPVFTAINCDEPVCGTSYFDGAFRDTDWWELDNSGDDNGTVYTITGLAEFDWVYGRVDNGCGALDCSQVTAFAEVAVGGPCSPIEVITPNLLNCVAWFFVGCDFLGIVDCNQPAGGPPAETGDRYILDVQCATSSPPCPRDLDGSGSIDFGDLLKILSFWGPCPE